MDRYYLYSFKNIYAFDEFLKHETAPMFGSYVSSREIPESFCKTKSWEEAEGLLSEGWSAPVDRMADLMVNKVMSSKNKLKRDVVGCVPVVPAAINGAPKSLMTLKRQPQKQSHINIIYNMTAHCHVSSDDLLRAGICVLNLCTALDNAHASTKIDIIPKFSWVLSSPKTDTKEIAACMVNIKDYAQPFNLKKMAYPLAHVSFFRRQGFRFLENLKELKTKKWLNGYGVSFGTQTGMHPMEKEALKKFHVDKNSVYIKFIDIVNARYDYKALAKNKGISL